MSEHDETFRRWQGGLGYVAYAACLDWMRAFVAYARTRGVLFEERGDVSHRGNAVIWVSDSLSISFQIEGGFLLTVDGGRLWHLMDMTYFPPRHDAWERVRDRADLIRTRPLNFSESLSERPHLSRLMP